MAHETKAETSEYTEELSTLKAELSALRGDMSKLVNTVMDLTKHSAGAVKDKAKAEVEAKLGQLHDAYDSVREQGGNACAKVQDTVEEHPMASVLVALGAGLLIGHLLRRDAD